MTAPGAGRAATYPALDPDESDSALTVAEQGMEVDPPAPHTPSGRLTPVARRLERPRAECGPAAAR